MTPRDPSTGIGPVDHRQDLVHTGGEPLDQEEPCRLPQNLWINLAAFPIIVTTTVRAVAAFTALFARTKQRREDSRAVLRLLRADLRGVVRGRAQPDPTTSRPHDHMTSTT